MFFQQLLTESTSGALAALDTHRPDLDAPPKADPRQRSLGFKEAGRLCISLCKGSAPNQLLLYLMYKDAILESMVAGDSSPSHWRSLGEVVATATYLGLHASTQDESTYVPTASSEAKRRLVSQIFVIDKVAASFCGRPPLLNRRYMLTPPPLDLADEALLGGPNAFNQAVQELGEQGWNADGHLLHTTMVRARRLLMYVTDEVMEIALGNVMHTSIDVLL